MDRHFHTSKRQRPASGTPVCVLRCDADQDMQALVVAPSQELAMQIVRAIEMVLPPDAKQAVQQLIGGANIHRQVKSSDDPMLECTCAPD